MKEKLFKKDRGVSPVIGVILMVAITVILAAVIGAFVLGFQDQAADRVPQASIGMDATLAGSGNEDGEIVFTHEGGENVFNDDIRVLIRKTSNGSITEWDPVAQADAQILRTGGETTLNYTNVSSNDIGGSWRDDWSNYSYIGEDSYEIEFTALERNDQYRVMLIHDESGRTVADQTVTAR